MSQSQNDARRKSFASYLHSCADQCLDDSGTPAFNSNELYTCSQVANAGFCSYLNFGSFQCAKKLLQYEYKLCSAHFRRCSDQKPSDSDKKPVEAKDEQTMSPSKVPYFLREKRESCPQETATALLNWNPFDWVEPFYEEKNESESIVEENSVTNRKKTVLKNEFNESFVVDDATEQAIECLLITILMEICN